MFEFCHGLWLEQLDNVTSPAKWDVLEKQQEWNALAPKQQFRHRLSDDRLYLGNGYTSVPFTLLEHPNMIHKPAWRASFVLAVDVLCGLLLVGWGCLAFKISL